MAGNIVKVKDGQYRLRYRDHSKYIKAKSDREAQKQLAKFITEVDSGDFSQPSRITFKEFVYPEVIIPSTAELKNFQFI